MFNLTDYFNIGILRSSNKLLTMQEVGEIHKKYSPKGVEIRVHDGESGAEYIHRIKRIEICSKDLYEEVLLHEIAHAVLSVTKGTANYKVCSLKTGDKLSRDLLIENEKEAWEWAEKHSSKPFGLRTKLAIKVSLRSYEVHNSEVLEVKLPSMYELRKMYPK